MLADAKLGNGIVFNGVCLTVTEIPWIGLRRMFGGNSAPDKLKTGVVEQMSGQYAAQPNQPLTIEKLD